MHSVHFDADQKLTDFIQKRADKLETFYDGIIDGEVIMTKQSWNAAVGLIALVSVVTACNTGKIVPEPGKITVEDALEDVGKGINRMYATKDDEKLSVGLLPSEVVVSLTPRSPVGSSEDDLDALPPTRTTIARNGSFEFADLQPGAYLLSAAALLGAGDDARYRRARADVAVMRSSAR